MSKITLTPLVNLQNETTAVNAINANDAVIVTAFDNTLSRDGTNPNTMGASLDMNSNQIINLPAPSTVNSPARLIDVVSNPSIVVPGTGTSGHVVPFLDGNNTWSGTNTYSSASTFNGNTALNGTVNGANNLTVTGTFTSTNNINNASLATMAANTAKGSIAGGTPADLSKTQLTTLINPVTSALSGAAPASGGGTTNFLRADATWAAPPASAVTLLNTLTASASATLSDITSLTATYSSYELVFQNIIPATNNVTFELQVHSGGAFQTATYLCSTTGFSNGSATVIPSSPTTFVGLSPPASAPNTSAGLSGYVRVQLPTQTTVPKLWHGLIAYAGATLTGYSSVNGMWNNTSAIDGFQVLFSSGNITSGTIKIYGIT